MRKSFLRSATETDPHMANPSRYPGTPRWVKVLGIIAIVVVVLFVILHLTSDRFRFHAPLGDHSGHTPPIEHRVQQP